MDKPRQRVFFALWPEPDVARALHDAARLAHTACGGRLMQRDTLHITLAFLGDVDAGQLDAACKVAAGVAAEKVGAGETVLTLDRLGYWPHNHIVWAGCDPASVALPALGDIAGDLAARLRERGFPIDNRPFVAHATLLRNARCQGELPPLPPVAWPAREFVLVASQLEPDGPHYRILRRWPLG